MLIWSHVNNLSSVIEPRVHGVTGRTQVRLSKLVFLGPAERCVTQTLLNHCVEPSQQEVEASPLIGSLGTKQVYIDLTEDTWFETDIC